MLSFLLKKMFKNKWMIVSLLIGNILLIATVASVPIYSEATLQRMLTRELRNKQLNQEKYPGLCEITMSSIASSKEEMLRMYKSAREFAFTTIPKEFDLPTIEKVEMFSVRSESFYLTEQRETVPQRRNLNITSFSDFELHSKIVQGGFYGNEITDNTIDGVVSLKTLEEQELLIGDIIESSGFEYMGKPLRIRICGAYEVRDEQDFYWVLPPAFLPNHIAVPRDVFEKIFIDNYSEEFRFELELQVLLDYNHMKIRNIPMYLSLISDYYDKYGDSRSDFQYRGNFGDTLDTYRNKSQKLNLTLWVLQVPVFVLLAFFIFMVSKQILIIEQNEISVIKSRGASRRQIILLYLLQGLIIVVASMLIGIPVGTLICRILGASNGFLNLINRSALRIELVSDAFLYSALAGLLSLLTMIVPVISYSSVTIVDYKRGRAGRKKALWQMFFLDILALGVSAYALYSYYIHKDTLISDTGARAIDPLIFLSSSLFIVGLGLFFLRIFPVLMKLLFSLGRKFWTPAWFASFLRIIRSAGDEQFIMIFLVFTMAVGIFDAKAARTINLNIDDKIMYENGADIVLKDIWMDNSSWGETGSGRALSYIEPDFERYKNITGVKSATKVLRESVTLVSDNVSVQNCDILGIVTNEFAETAWSRQDLYSDSATFNRCLNALASDPTAVLLSTNFKTEMGLSIGNVITVWNQRGTSCQAIVYGFVDYWPGFKPVNRMKTPEGAMVEIPNSLIVANLNYLQSQWGITPYQVWIKSETDSNNYMYDYATDKKIQFALFKDSRAEIIENKNESVMQGTNGVLTVGFIITLIICTAGFLIYWILSIKSRVLQFGIFRAMGMSMRNILALLINEQVFISGIAIAIGVLVGEIASRAFVPLIQIAYTASEQSVPLLIITQREDYFRLFAVIAVMFCICMAVLAWLISRIKIAQALKLGED